MFTEFMVIVAKYCPAVTCFRPVNVLYANPCSMYITFQEQEILSVIHCYCQNPTHQLVALGDSTKSGTHKIRQTQNHKSLSLPLNVNT